MGPWNSLPKEKNLLKFGRMPTIFRNGDAVEREFEIVIRNENILEVAFVASHVNSVKTRHEPYIHVYIIHIHWMLHNYPCGYYVC